MLGKPLTTVTLHPDLVAAIDRRVAQERMIVVCADPAFGTRIRSAHGGGDPNRIRVVLASDAAAVAALDPGGPVLLTRVAQEQLGPTNLTSLVPPAPFISPESAREIGELMIRLHMEAEHGAN